MSKTIEIRKFEFAADHMANYFDNPIYRDTIVFTEIIEDSYPNYNKEYEKQFEAFAIQFSNQTLKFSLRQAVTSSVGKLIEQFFTEDISNHCLAARIETDEIVGGMVDIEKIWFNKTYSEGRYDIQLDVWSFDEEFKKLGNRPPFIPSQPIQPEFEHFLNGSFFRDGTSQYWHFDVSQLDWVAKIGYQPFITWEFWQAILADKQGLDTTIWALFKDLIQHYGIVYQEFAITGTHLNYFTIAIKLIFRDYSAENITIVQSETLEHGYIRNTKANKWLFWKMAKITGDSSGFYGILSDGQDASGHKFYARGTGVTGGALNGIERATLQYDRIILWDINNSVQTFVLQTDVNIIEFSKYFNAYAGGYQWLFSNGQEYNVVPSWARRDYSFPALWTKQGYTFTIIPNVTPIWKLIIHPDNVYSLMSVSWTLMISQYKFLYRDFLYKVYKLRLVLSSLPYNTKLFVKTIINSVNLKLYKLTNKNLAVNKVDSVWYEDINQ